MKSLLNFISLRGRAKTRPITLIGALPARKSSVVALVLAKLLSGQKVNAIDIALEAQTSRVKDLVSTLRKQHGWGSICSEKIAVGTYDGRVQWVCQYWLPIDVLDQSRTHLTLEWVNAVFESRRIMKLNSRYAKRRAQACNSRQRLTVEGGK